VGGEGYYGSDAFTQGWWIEGVDEMENKERRGKKLDLGL
jgi:hypothetical protein